MKTLVDEIRDIVCEARTRGMYPVATDAAKDMLGRSCWSKDDEAELFAAIADRIEREYLPRPRFEDGEPVQFGDEFYSDEHGKTYKATMFVVYADGSFRVNQAGCNACQYEPGERVKRPEPDVLDADGVPIRKGDTVYPTKQNGAIRPFEVKGFNDGYVLVDYRDRNPDEEQGDWNSYLGEQLTHKQPDTLERIEADAMKMLNDYWGCGDADCRCCQAIVYGKKPYERYSTEGCAAAQKLDLLRRQRELLERGHE